MRDSKSVVQEVQKELLAVVQRGQEQVRKGQDRVRKSQEQARKSRDAVVSVVHAGSELAKAARASRPTLPPVRIPSPAEVRAHAQELAGQAITAQRDFAVKARHAAGPVAERVLTAQRELAGKARQAGLDHAAAAQRSLAGRVVEVAKVATPIVAEGRTRLTQLVSALQPGHQPAAGADPTASQAAAATTATAEPEVAQQPTAAQVKTPAKPRTRTGSASTAKSTTARTSAAKTSTAKPSTGKTSAAKTSTRPAAGSKSRSTPKK